MAEQPPLKWFTSSCSGTPDNECVECAGAPERMVLRDSKTPRGPHVEFTRSAWKDFTAAVRTGTFRRG